MFSENNFNDDDDAVFIARDIGPYHHFDQLESLHCHLSDLHSIGAVLSLIKSQPPRHDTSQNINN